MPDVLVTGAGGWVGRNALDHFLAARGAGASDVVTGFARAEREVHLGADRMFPVAAMDQFFSSTLSEGSVVVLCGFPTQDQVDAMGEAIYIDAITQLRRDTVSLLRGNPPVDIVYLSSGAATSVQSGHDVATRTRVYGQAKIDDEEALREAVQATGGRLCVVRAFALSGPYMTKPDTYALGNMIMQALERGTIEVKATRPVRRSYMSIDDMLRVAVHAVGELPSGGAVTFETAGEVVEMGVLAERVLAVLGRDPSAVRRPPIDHGAPADDYVGDSPVVRRLAGHARVELAPLDEQIALTADWLRGGVE
jgi:nucleoside-diphosphate-sugar epimerase